MDESRTVAATIVAHPIDSVALQINYHVKRIEPGRKYGQALVSDPKNAISSLFASQVFEHPDYVSVTR